MEINADIEIDLSGLRCPMPLLKAKLALNSMDSTQVLKVVATETLSKTASTAIPASIFCSCRGIPNFS